MENPKLINRNTMNKPNSRTIGINTDMNLMNIKCVKCLQDCVKFTFFPYYFPYPFPICNCMIFSHFQNNVAEYPNVSCKCENKNYNNSCSHHYIQNCHSSSSSSSCKHCGSKSSCNADEGVYQTTSKDSVDAEERHERLNVSLRSSRNSLQAEDFEKVYPKDEREYNNTSEEISNSNITKYASDFLEKSYRSKYGYKSRTHSKNEDNSDVQNENNSNEKQLLNHLLKPNTSSNKNIVVENEDSDDYIDSDNEENISEDDDYSGKTVIRAPGIEQNKKERPASSDDRRPTRININNTTHSQPTSQHSIKRPPSQTRNPDVEMLMMIKALVNNQYDNSNSPPLNKLLNHIGSENPAPSEPKITSTPRRKLPSKNVINLTPKLSENKKPS